MSVVMRQISVRRKSTKGELPSSSDVSDSTGVGSTGSSGSTGSGSDSSVSGSIGVGLTFTGGLAT